MNEQKKWTIVLMTITVFMTTAMFLPGLVRAGDLEPSAPPGSTMHTLDEIYNKLATIDTKLEPDGEPCESLRAGDLEPSAPPGSTMHTLDEIYNKLAMIDTKLEPNGEPCEPCEEAPVPKTGQTTAYVSGDDGYLEKGVAWPVPRFTDHDDGTVTDNLTGLMWTRNANMYGHRTWAEALSDCAGCTEGGYDDWRLPNVRELQSLIDYGRYGPALSDDHPFDHVQSSYYWSSSTYTGSTSTAWSVSLSYGAVSYIVKTSTFYVWCVRGGQ